MAQYNQCHSIFTHLFFLSYILNATFPNYNMFHCNFFFRKIFFIRIYIYICFLLHALWQIFRIKDVGQQLPLCKTSSNHLSTKTLGFSTKLIKSTSLHHKITGIFTSESLYCITVQNIWYIKTFWLRFVAAFLLCTSTHTILNTTLIIVPFNKTINFFSYIMKVNFFFDWLCHLLHFTLAYSFEKFKSHWSLWMMTPPFL
jgi:hypothetical protein